MEWPQSQRICALVPGWETEQNPVQASQGARNEIIVTNHCASFSWSHLGLVLSLVIGFGTKSKWFYFTRQVRNQTPWLWLAWFLPEKLSWLWCLCPDSYNFHFWSIETVPQAGMGLTSSLISSPSSPILLFRTQQVFASKQSVYGLSSKGSNSLTFNLRHSVEGLVWCPDSTMKMIPFSNPMKTIVLSLQ